MCATIARVVAEGEDTGADVVQGLDALANLVVVEHGWAIEAHPPLDAALVEAHRTNMAPFLTPPKTDPYTKPAVTHPTIAAKMVTTTSIVHEDRNCTVETGGTSSAIADYTATRSRVEHGEAEHYSPGQTGPVTRIS